MKIASAARGVDEAAAHFTMMPSPGDEQLEVISVDEYGNTNIQK